VYSLQLIIELMRPLGRPIAIGMYGLPVRAPLHLLLLLLIFAQMNPRCLFAGFRSEFKMSFLLSHMAHIVHFMIHELDRSKMSRRIWMSSGAGYDVA